MPLLYGEVILRRVGQLFALVRTLRENTKEYVHVIWGITLMFHIPEGYKSLIEQNLAYILTHCPNLRSLSFTSAFADWLPLDSTFTGEPIDNPLAVALRQAGPRITKFEYFDAELSATKRLYVLPTQLIRAFSVAITSLTLLLPPSVASGSVDNIDTRITPDIPALNLETLESLTLWHRNPDNSLLVLKNRWHMPRLRSVAFRSMLCDYDVKMETYYKFFEKFGRGLKYLDFGPYRISKRSPEILAKRIDKILGLCPSLQHLVGTDFCLTEEVKTITSGLLPLHIDIWLQYPINYLHEWHIEKLLTFPDHRGFIPNVRILDASLNYLPNLPRLLPPIPNYLDGDSPLVHRMTGFSIVETRWCIFRQSEDWDGDWDGLPETLSEVMEPYEGPYHSDASSTGSYWGSESRKSGTGSDVCSHHSQCRYRLPDSSTSSSSYFDSEEEDDADQLPYLDRRGIVGAYPPDEPPAEPENIVHLTDEDILEIFTTQLESNRIPSRDSY